MKDYESGYTPLVKGDMSSLNQCPKNDLEINNYVHYGNARMIFE